MEAWSIDLLKRLEWPRFEELCIQYFRQLGFDAEASQMRSDGGRDIHLKVEGREQPAILAQCKCWRGHSVNANPVRAMHAIMAERSIGEGVMLTPTKFSAEARELAAACNITLIDGPDLVKKIEALLPGQSALLLSVAQGRRAA